MALGITYEPISGKTVTRGFCCGEKELDKFFTRGGALKDHEQGTILTTCAYLPGIAAPDGYYSIATVSEEATILPSKYHSFGKGEHFPALQLVYLAVHRRHQRCGIGISMAGAVVEMFANVGQRLGIPHLILVPINEEVIAFYEERLGFTCYKNRDRMYLPLQDAVDAMRTPPASETGDLFDEPSG